MAGQDLLLFEVKAKFFSLDARTGRSQEEFFKRLHEIVVDGAWQLDESLKHLRHGRLESLGLTQKRVRRVFPVVVSLDPVPMSAPLRSWIDEQISSRELLRALPGDEFELMPLEVCSARDLEWLEAIIDGEPIRPGDLLHKKVSTPYGRSVGLTTWTSTHPLPTPRILRSYPIHHEKRWDTLAEGAVEFFRTGGQRN
jgi:hypothetical protein